MRRYSKILSVVFVIFLFTAIVHGQELKSYYTVSSECDSETDIERVQNRIIDFSLNDDTLNLRLGIIANCSGIHNVRTIIANDTLRIDFEQGGELEKEIYNKGDTVFYYSYASCDCCYEFTFKIFEIDFIPKNFTLNDSVIFQTIEKYKTYPVTYEIINNDTINYTDRYGLAQGYWFKEYENNGYWKGYMVDDEVQTSESESYYENGNLKTKRSHTDVRIFRIESYYEDGTPNFFWINNTDTLSSVSMHFYKNGTLKSSIVETQETYEKKEFFENGRIKILRNGKVNEEYYSNGQLKKEYLYPKEHVTIVKYYYDSGELMANYYIEELVKRYKDVKRYTDKNGKRKKEITYSYGMGNFKREWTCFEKTVKKTTKQELKNKGYDFLRD